MSQVNIHQAKSQLSLLLEKMLEGEEIIIAKAGKPIAKLIPYTTPKPKIKFGLLKGKIKVPDDFNRMGQAEIAALFGHEKL